MRSTASRLWGDWSLFYGRSFQQRRVNTITPSLLGLIQQLVGEQHVGGRLHLGHHDRVEVLAGTLAIGDPGDEARECYTRVLQGMIAISRVRFPKGLPGRDIDALARFNLWVAGQDYDHGTGHGGGAFLSVM